MGTMRLRQSRADRLRGIGDAAAPKDVKACAGGASPVRRPSRGAGAHDPSYLSVDRILISPWYRRIFPTRLAQHRHAVQEFVTTRQGYRLATSTGGVLTGRGADFILIDDALKPEEALSEAQRNGTNGWYGHSLYSRLNDKRHGAIAIIM